MSKEIHKRLHGPAYIGIIVILNYKPRRLDDEIISIGEKKTIVETTIVDYYYDEFAILLEIQARRL